MDLHHKIIEILNQEFPTLAIPEIQKGFKIAITVTLERLAPDPKTPVQYMEFSYFSETGDFTYVPFLLGSGIAHPTTVEEFQTELQWAKENGPFKVNASFNFVCPSITVYNKTTVNSDNNFSQETFTDDEIKMARERENDTFGVEVPEDKFKIKVFPKDKDNGRRLSEGLFHRKHFLLLPFGIFPHRIQYLFLHLDFQKVSLHYRAKHRSDIRQR